MDTRLRALNRFGLGARIGEAQRLGDAREWLLEQVGASAVQLPSSVSADEMSDALRAYRMTDQGDQRERQQARQRLVRLVASEQQQAIAQRIRTKAPFAERMVAFWSNHLCVSVGAKLTVGPFAGSYERDVIRRHVFGRFEDMVLASARHPAMLFYLDNFQSIGPASRAAQGARRRRGQQRGLNENYARELLELHTLGVDGGYTQTDVTELARILTGWTIRGLNDRRDGLIEYQFVDLAHEPGDKTVLGKTYREAGEREGTSAIHALCEHPSTARFVARKLVQHFVSDDPPAAAVDRLADVFRKTDGDLAAVTRALVELPDAWRTDARKFRTPQDWLVAVLRSISAPDANQALLPALRQLRHPLWSPQAPKGFGDLLQDWADPDSLLNRAELARTIAKRAVRSNVDPRALLEVIDVASNDPLRGMLTDSRINAEERFALAFAAPAFQWR